MVVVPPATPDTIPVLPTVAIVVLVLLHVPPVVPSLKDVVAPAHMVAVPLIAPGTGKGLTVKVTGVVVTGGLQ